MSKSNAFETAILALIFDNANIANVGDATGLRGSTTVGSLYMSLHTADPGEASDQTTSEIAYTSYARTAVPRDTGFNVSGNAAALAANVDFPTGTGGSGTANNWGCGTVVSGAGLLMFKGSISPAIVCGNGVTPRLNAGTLVTED